MILFIRRYASFLKPFLPRLSAADLTSLRELSVFRSTVPFPLIEVKTSALIDYTGVAYADPAHPHQLALHAQSGSAAFRQHFAKFQPGSLADLWDVADPELANIDASNFSTRGPFGTQDIAIKRPAGDCAHYGPVSQEFVASEWSRLGGSQNALKGGYNPWRHWDGFLRGTVITDGERMRFLVTAGKHRAAVVAKQLDTALVRLEWNPMYVPVVDTRRITDLPQVRASIWTPELATQVAQFFLKGRGNAVH